MMGAARNAGLGGELSVWRLIESIDRYLSSFSGKGITEVCDGIGRCRPAPFTVAPHRTVSACVHLEAALAQCDRPLLAGAIRQAAPYLSWDHYDSYPIKLIGSRFAEAHGYAALIGGGGPVKAHDFDLGLFLIEPHIFYRDHRHAAPELYAPLTGPHGWRFRPGDRLTLKPAHEPVWNAPWQPHATMTGDVPFLAIYCWTKDVNNAAEVVPCDDWDELEMRP